MARKGKKRKKLKEIKEQNNAVKSKKKMGKHELDRMVFPSRATEKMYDKLAMEFVEGHLPKIMDIVPKEVREARKDSESEYRGNKPGQLYKGGLETINTKETYVKRFKTFLKWQVINKGITTLGQINEQSTREFFDVIANNIGKEKGKYSTKTYDSYVAGVHKGMKALTTKPEEAKVQIEGREMSPPVQSLRNLTGVEFKREIADKVKNYSQNDYKRGRSGGYTVREANIIMKQAEKNLNTEEQLLMATLIYGATRVDEARNMSLDCYDTSEKRINMLKPYMNKQDRPRVVMDVNPKLMDLVEKYKEQYNKTPDAKIFEKYSTARIRDIVKDCCRKGKVGYSAVHDFRKSFTARSDTAMYKAVLKGRITKKEIVEKIMKQVGADPRLNPEVPKVEWKKKKGGYYPQKVKVNGQHVMEQKFTYKKLMKKNIENLIDLFLAEQLGHNKMETNQEYRSPEMKEKRKEFRSLVKQMRKQGVKGL